MRRWRSIPLLLFVSCARATSPALAPVAAPGVPTGPITGDELRRDLYAFADDSMRGRETGTPDADRAMRFLVERVRSLGLEPAGDSLYLQRVPLVRETFGPASFVHVSDAAGVTALRFGTDLEPLINLGDGAPPTRRSADGELVFVSYGLGAGGGRHDDFAGLDLHGKVVVVLNGAPATADAATRTALESEAAISDRLARILPQRPAAVILLMTGKGREFYEMLAPSLERAVVARSAAADLPEDERPLPMIFLGVPRAGSPLLPASWPADDRAQALAGRRFTARVDQERATLNAYNVLAVVRGSDPALSATYVAFGAHYDHVGMLGAVAGDSIANGADDDGSGSVALLAVARALQQMPRKPRRSTLFVWHVGEEKGLLGSSWFVEHPTVPIDSIVAQINADMIGRNAPELLYPIGPLAAPNNQSRRLGVVVDSVNRAQPRPFAFDRTLDSPSHPEHLYERSDHANYARKGVPIVFFTSGLHADYHKVTDEPAKIDYEKLARVSRLLFDIGVAVAESPRRPR